MNPLKILFSQTVIYGLSSIVARFLNYLLVPLFTYIFAPAEYGVIAEFYAYMGFFAILLMFGLETGYFRFREKESSLEDSVYSTALGAVAVGSIAFFMLLFLLREPIAEMLHHGAHPEYVWWASAILALDAVSSIAFARLRAENRAWRFASVRVFEIVVNISINLFFIVFCRHAYEIDPNSLFGQLWNPAIGVGYIFIANLVASGVKMLLLSPQFREGTAGFNPKLFNRMLRYSMPMVVIGFAGIVNEMFDRAALKYLLPYDTKTNMAQLGIYAACYKLSILMSLFIQAFRYAEEPFFFSHAKETHDRKVYAEVMNYFVIFCVFIFLLVTLYIDIFKYFIGEPYREGLQVVPILLMANLLLGIYVTLSKWYKLSDHTWMGAGVATMGSAVSVVLLFCWVPLFGYIGAAWATLVCYGSMVFVSWVLGCRYYPVPYDLKRLVAYPLVGVTIYIVATFIDEVSDIHPLLTGTTCVLLFITLAYVSDGRRLIKQLMQSKS